MIRAKVYVIAYTVSTFETDTPVRYRAFRTRVSPAHPDACPHPVEGESVEALYRRAILEHCQWCCRGVQRQPPRPTYA